jgi:hypothetical protein
MGDRMETNMTTNPPPIHYAPEDDDRGICGLPGYLVESQKHVTCEWCRDKMRAENVRAGKNADGSERRVGG